MSAPEPLLRAEDRRAWDAWMRTAMVHSRTLQHRRAVDAARRTVETALEHVPSWACMWSGGKDSTAMTHLVCVDRGARIQVLSEKDDLDFPGERAYVERMAAAWGLDLRILTPEVSPTQWISDHAHELEVVADFHSRSAGLSKACFYDLVEKASEPFDGVFLGLRQEESLGRRADRASHHTVVRGARVLGLYQYRSGRRAGRWKACPIGGWSGLDVYAYLAARDIELLDVYRCLGFMHAREPWHLRKSWWIPAQSHSRKGGVAWLRRYYPSLYAQLLRWFPRSGTIA